MQPLARLCVGSDCSIGRIAISPATASRGHRRWQTMHNRWQAHKGAACGEVAPIIMCLEVAQHCSTSSTPNDSEVSSSPQVSLTLHQRLSMVKHLRRLLYSPVLRNLRERRHDHRVLLGVLPYPPTINDCKHLITSNINRASGYNLHNPTLAPQATMWGQPNTPHHQQPRRGCRPNNIRSQNPQNHKNLINLSEFNHLSAFSAPLCEKITAPMVPSVLPYSLTSFYAGD